ncbi:hypothetical protein OUZ56_017388 [Daphnia magna]|uniref:Uncharacterized protein n=1 Tax=Daphnia magna TaxID=35525 RepID=A0ABR0ASP6_9CRUS|nr:hypothetical protein OUZ56_017388 [Daphnia magna]
MGSATSNNNEYTEVFMPKQRVTTTRDFSTASSSSEVLIPCFLNCFASTFSDEDVLPRPSLLVLGVSPGASVLDRDEPLRD